MAVYQMGCPYYSRNIPDGVTPVGGAKGEPVSMVPVSEQTTENGPV